MVDRITSSQAELGSIIYMAAGEAHSRKEDRDL